MHIKTYALELTKRQRKMKKNMEVPCDDAFKVMTYVDTMNKSGFFKEEELVLKENTPNLQGWKKTQDHFATI